MNTDMQMRTAFTRTHRGRAFDPCSLDDQRYAQAWRASGGHPAGDPARLLLARLVLVLELLTIPLRLAFFLVLVFGPRARNGKLLFRMTRSDARGLINNYYRRPSR